MLNVLYTVDTEVWPRTDDWRETGMVRELDCDVRGRTADGDFGVGYQIDVLNAHGLKGVFLVESLFACAVGVEPLRGIVSQAQSGGHEAQLHLHTEWLRRVAPPMLGGRTGSNLRDFNEDEQAALIGRGLENLRAAGAEGVCAFRAGNYGANWTTLRALARCGVRYDTSHNTCYLGTTCDMPGPGLLQPKRIEGVWELPVSYFQDWPGHYRHAQLCACSAREMEAALWQAWRQGWHSFVIVSHSFEMVRRPEKPGGLARPDRIVVRRFARLCKFLAAHRDKFRSVGFNDLDPAGFPAEQPARPLRSRLYRTAWRLGEQVVRRLRV